MKELLILIPLLLFAGCASTRPVSNPSLGGIAASINVAKDLNNDVREIVKKIEADGATAHSAESKLAVAKVAELDKALKAAEQATVKSQEKVIGLAIVADGLRTENTALKNAGGKLGFYCYLLAVVLFIAGWIVGSTVLAGLNAAGWSFLGPVGGWLSAAVTCLAKKIGMANLAGIVVVAIGGVLLRLLLPIIASWGWLIRWLF